MWLKTWSSSLYVGATTVISPLLGYKGHMYYWLRFVHSSLSENGIIWAHEFQILDNSNLVESALFIRNCKELCCNLPPRILYVHTLNTMINKNIIQNFLLSIKTLVSVWLSIKLPKTLYQLSIESSWEYI